MEIADIGIQEMGEAFEYLDDLRQSGVTNMFGAAPYLVRDMNFQLDVARAVLSRWADTFDRDSPPETRAAKALGEKS